MIQQRGGRLALIDRQLAVPNDLPHRVAIVAGCALERLSWRSAQRIVDEPPIWAGIRGRRASRADPAGQRALSGERVKEIMGDAGVEPDALRQSVFAHCSRRHAARETAKFSRRFEHSLSWWTMVATSSCAANCGDEIEIASFKAFL